MLSEPWLCCLLAGWPWISYWISLSTNFFTYKSERVTPILCVYCEGHGRCLVSFLPLSFHKSLVYFPWTKMKWTEHKHHRLGTSSSATHSSFPFPPVTLFFPSFSWLFLFQMSRMEHLLQALSKKVIIISNVKLQPTLWPSLPHTLDHYHLALRCFLLWVVFFHITMF